MNPFFPKSEKISNVIVAGDADQVIKESLKELGLNLIETEAADFLYDSVKYHPDIQLHPIDENTMAVAGNMLEIYREKLEGLDTKLIPTEKEFSGSYPDYTGLNIGRVESFYIHNPRYTDETAKKLFEEQGIVNIPVKQGYSKCSTLTIADNAVITTDRGIEKVLKSIDSLEVHYISPEGIHLEGMNYGFIGGCGAMLSEKKLMLTGRTDGMKAEKRFHEILGKYGIDVIYLSDNGINDIGGFILF